MKAIGWLLRFGDNFWYYWVSRGTRSGYQGFPFEMALQLAYEQASGWQRFTEPAWGGDMRDYYD